MRKFVITAIAKNEDDYLAEWIAFHLAVGATHVYIYDNSSTIPISISMKPYVDAGWLTVIDWPQPGGQMLAYTHFVENFGAECQWVGIIDVDEYIIPKQHDNVPDILEDFATCGGLAVNWKLFGSNNHIEKPTVGLTIENFIMGSTNIHYPNRHIKSIIQPSKTLKAGRDPHHMVYNSPYFAVNEHHQYVNGPFNTNISWDKIQINHYVTRSLEEYKIKVKRTRADTNNPSLPGRRLEEFIEFNEHPEIDTCALKFSDKTKQIMDSIK